MLRPNWYTACSWLPTITFIFLYDDHGWQGDTGVEHHTDTANVVLNGVGAGCQGSGSLKLAFGYVAAQGGGDGRGQHGAGRRGRHPAGR